MQQSKLDLKVRAELEEAKRRIGSVKAALTPSQSTVLGRLPDSCHDLLRVVTQTKNGIDRLVDLQHDLEGDVLDEVVDSCRAALWRQAGDCYWEIWQLEHLHASPPVLRPGEARRLRQAVRKGGVVSKPPGTKIGYTQPSPKSHANTVLRNRWQAEGKPESRLQQWCKSTVLLDKLLLIEAMLTAVR